MKPGYKLTEVGMLPVEWDVTTVGEEFSVQLGKMLDAARNVGVRKPYLGNKAVQWDRIDSTNLPTVPMSRADIDKYRLRDGDLLVCEGGEVGRAAIWNGPLEECYFQKALHRLRPLRGFEARLLVAILHRWSDRGILANFVTQTSIAHLPRERFMLVPIPRPPQCEQRAITAALSDVDALLGGLDRLIAKKRDLRQAAMQQLLTGRTRLPGFHANWEVKRLGDHVTFLRHGVNSRAELTVDDPVRYVHYGDIHACRTGMLDPSNLPRLPAANAKALDRLRDGDLILADASEDLAGVGKSVEICGVGDTELVSGLHTIAARFDKTVLADGFKAYLQFCPGFSGHLRRLAAGTKVYATNKANVANIEMPLPDIDEQTAIASVLGDMEAELSALEMRRDKTQALKQAMTQELLTGRTRLVIPAVEEKREVLQTATPSANIYFQRSVLAAEIIDRLHDEPTLGHVKFEKVIFLVEHLCRVDTGSAYHRDAAGPYDNQALRSIDSQLRKQKWFDARKVGDRYRYEPLANRGKHKEYFERYFADIRPSFDTIIDTFRTLTTERCEIVATLFGAWNDLIQAEAPISDDAIVNEVLNNWHESKKRIPEDRWRKALSWMRDKGLVPRSEPRPR